MLTKQFQTDGNAEHSRETVTKKKKKKVMEMGFLKYFVDTLRDKLRHKCLLGGPVETKIKKTALKD